MSQELIDQLKAMLENPDIKGALQELLKEEPKAKPSTKSLEVWDTVDGDKDVAKATTIDQKIATERVRSTRPPVMMITKRCYCGREETVVKGGPLDLPNFRCNRCQTG